VTESSFAATTLRPFACKPPLPLKPVNDGGKARASMAELGGAMTAMPLAMTAVAAAAAPYRLTTMDRDFICSSGKWKRFVVSFC
jgi:hypothetical protein